MDAALGHCFESPWWLVHDKGFIHAPVFLRAFPQHLKFIKFHPQVSIADVRIEGNDRFYHLGAKEHHCQRAAMRFVCPHVAHVIRKLIRLVVASDIDIANGRIW
jgi:hypothetical protein